MGVAAVTTSLSEAGLSNILPRAHFQRVLLAVGHMGMSYVVALTDSFDAFLSVSLSDGALVQRTTNKGFKMQFSQKANTTALHS